MMTGLVLGLDGKHKVGRSSHAFLVSHLGVL